jgi:orotidine-5'-phosphate decarboxylase
MLKPENRLIVALDVQDGKNALDLVSLLHKKVEIFKIGLSLFCKEGPEIVKKVIKFGVKVFLDLKFNDIPNTMANAVESISYYSPYMFTVHISSGKEALKRIVSITKQVASKMNIPKPLIMGVTVLTSINQKIIEDEFNIRKNIRSIVHNFALIAKDAGLDGVISSGYDATCIRKSCGKEFIIVVPGIRPRWWVKKNEDQKQILTPYSAIKNGADLIVVGRPIIESDNPLKAVDRIIEEIYQATKNK